MGSQLKYLVVVLLMSAVLTKCDEYNEEPVEMMTTVEPIDADDHTDFILAANSTFSTSKNCSQYSCDMCGENNCTWVTCHDVLDDWGLCTDTVTGNCTVTPCEQDPCKNLTGCDQCGNLGKVKDCEWVQCTGSDEGPFCGQAAELCPVVPCNATIPTTTPSPPETTTNAPETTTVPVTTPAPDTPTPSPDTPTTPTPAPDTPTTPTPSPDTPTTPPPTEIPPTESPTTAAPSTTTPGPSPAPQSGGFSAGSFFGGITLTLSLIGMGLGGYKFYKTRYDVNYRTL